MPLYQYQCLAKGHAFEVRQPITSDPVAECPQCGGEVRRIIHPVGIVFKGSGFYATDSRGKGVGTSHKPAEAGSSETKTESKGEGKGEGKTEGKPSTEAKPPPPSSTESSSSKPAGSSES